MNRASTETSAQVLSALAEGLPLVSRPYEALARRMGLEEAEVVAAARALLDAHALRRIAGVIDGARLGYGATLGALAVSEEGVDAAASAIASLPGVTHVFEAEDRYRLWFTLVTPARARIEALEGEIVRRTGASDLFRLLPGELHSVAASFDADGVPEPTAPGVEWPAAPALPADERALVRLLQGDLPLVPRPFAEVASTLSQCGFDVDERWVLERAAALVGGGVLVRIAATARTRPELFRLAVVAWRADGAAREAAEMVASFPEVLHCFERRLPRRHTALVSVVEAADKAALGRTVERIRAATGLEVLRLLYPVREFKRAPMRYFADGEW